MTTATKRPTATGFCHGCGYAFNDRRRVLCDVCCKSAGHPFGARYGGTVRRTKANVDSGLAGKVLMLCRECGEPRYV